MAKVLREKIADRSAVVAVVGLGYVGLPVAASFASIGFEVVGVDLDEKKIQSLRRGDSYIPDVSDAEVMALVDPGQLTVSDSFSAIGSADVVLICVPTPITEGAPDLSRVVAAGRGIAPLLKEGVLVVLESTTYPGSTEELLQPLLEEYGRKVGTDLFLAFSPERIDPGNPTYSFDQIPKIVGGVDRASTEVASLLYGQLVPKVVEVSGTREAELAKLIENTFRHVNIALVNELATYAHDMGIDIWEAIEAAASKPFGYMPFWPGPGWGGHCIPLDPSYLSWRVRQDRAHEVRFVELAHTVNSEMPRYVSERVSLLLNDQGKSVRNARILGVGAAYKRGTGDTRESGALKVLSRLAKQGAEISYHDPLVPEAVIGSERHSSVPLTTEAIAAQDAIVILVPQVEVDWALVIEEGACIFDCCNALGRRGGNITRL